MNDCELRPRLDAFHDEELSAVERARVEEHVRRCPRCAAELTTMEGMKRFLAAGTAPGISDEQLSRLARDVRADPAAALVRLFRKTAVAAMVVLACAVAAGAYLGSRTRGAAREAIVLDFATAPAQSPGASPAAGPAAPLADDQRVQLARWIVDDLATDRMGTP